MSATVLARRIEVRGGIGAARSWMGGSWRWCRASTRFYDRVGPGALLCHTDGVVADVLVIDNESSDGTPELVETHPRLRRGGPPRHVAAQSREPRVQRVVEARVHVPDGLGAIRRDHARRRTVRHRGRSSTSPTPTSRGGSAAASAIRSPCSSCGRRTRPAVRPGYGRVVSIRTIESEPLGQRATPCRPDVPWHDLGRNVTDFERCVGGLVPQENSRAGPLLVAWLNRRVPFECPVIVAGAAFEGSLKRGRDHV